MTTNTVTISVENLAPEQGTFLTPLWFGFHNGTFDTYDRGRPVSPGLESLAEDGATELISQEFNLAGFGTVQGTILGENGISGPIDPGEVATVTVELDSSDPSSQFFNYASMIIPSNDFFIANGNERAHQIFDEEGNFLGADFIILGSNVLDAGSEVNDEIPANTAFFGQQDPNTGVSENGVVQLAQGFMENGPILSDARFLNADYTQEGYEIARIRVFIDDTVFDGSGGEETVVVELLDEITINNFGGVGQGDNPSEEKLAELDTIQFEGEGLIAKNLLLTQKDDDLKVSFDVENSPQVWLTDFKLENLDNLSNGIGNILFDGDTEIEDSFDVIDKNSNPQQVLNRNTVTFLNDRHNKVRGFNNSDDVINGQGGNDRLNGLSGNDILRGGYGKDNLIGGSGDDYLIGNQGNDLVKGGGGDDVLVGSQGDDILIGNGGQDTFYFGGDIYGDGLEDLDLIKDFQSRDSFDFSKYLQTGGQVEFTRNEQRLLINLNDEDFIIVRGDLDAAQAQLEAII